LSLTDITFPHPSPFEAHLQYTAKMRNTWSSARKYETIRETIFSNHFLISNQKPNTTHPHGTPQIHLKKQ
jgi:hypothetical protein